MERQREEDVAEEAANPKKARIEEARFSLVKEGNLIELQSLVDNTPVENGERAELINAETDEGWTILHIAAQRNHLPIIEWTLSDSGGRAAGFTEVLAKTKYGQTTLHMAAQLGQFEMFQAIVDGCKAENGERAAMLNALEKQGSTVLHLAAHSGCIPLISWVLSDSEGRVAGFNRVLARTTDGKTALHYAILQGLETFLAIVEGCKVENGEQSQLLNAVSREGFTLLHEACLRGESEITSWLLSDSGGRAAGFDKVLARDVFGSTALHRSAEDGDSELFLELVEGCTVENGERAQLLNTVDLSRKTVLHVAAESGSAQIVEWLLSEEGTEAGFNRDNLFALTDKKENVLHIIAGAGFIPCFDAVISRCSSSNNTSERLRLFLGVDDKGWTIFHRAARWGRSTFILHVLLNYPEESKMIINMRDNRGMTVLHRTIILGLDNESRDEWGGFRESCKDATTAALLGFEDEFGDDDDDDTDDENGEGHNNNNNNNEEDDSDDEDEEGGEGDEGDDKDETRKARKVCEIAADPNVALKFEE